MKHGKILPPALLMCAIFGIAGCGKRGSEEFTTYAMIQTGRHVIPYTGTVNNVIERDIGSSVDVKTLVLTANSYDLKRRYWNALTRAGIADKIASPYLNGARETDDAAFKVFDQHFRVQQDSLSLIVRFEFTHRDGELARVVADTTAEEYLAYEAEAEKSQPEPVHSRLVSHAFPPPKR